MRQTALIVDDDPVTRHILVSTLATSSIESIIAEAGAAMWTALKQDPDVIILDLTLPDADGIELLRQLRQKSDIPVLIHSNRSDEIERIIGIEIGADDYLPKPFEPRELLARVKALLRRSAALLGDDEVHRFGRHEIDLGARQARIDGKPCDLTSHQFDLLVVWDSPERLPLMRTVTMHGSPRGASKGVVKRQPLAGGFRYVPDGVGCLGPISQTRLLVGFEWRRAWPRRLPRVRPDVQRG